MKKLLKTSAPYQLYKTIKNMGATKKLLENMEPIEETPQEVYFSGSTFLPHEYINTWCGSTVNVVEKSTLQPKDVLAEELTNKLKELK
jgi:hypothetical protein